MNQTGASGRRDLAEGRDLRVYILGCGGLIGSRLVAWLLERPGTQVTGTDLRHEALADVLADPRFAYYEGDPEHDERLVRRLIRRSDLVVVLDLGISPPHALAYFETSVLDRLRVIEWCASDGRPLVYLSPGSVYGMPLRSLLPGEAIDECAAPVREDTAPFIGGPLDDLRWLPVAAAQATERFLHVASLHHRSPYTILRVFDPVGPGIEEDAWRPPDTAASVIVTVVQALSSGKRVTLPCDPNTVCAPVYVADAVEAIGRLLIDPELTRSRQALNLGNPANATTVRDLAERILGLSARLQPDRAGQRAWRNGPVRFRAPATSGLPGPSIPLPDVSRAAALLGWKPAWGLHETLLATLDALLAGASLVDDRPLYGEATESAKHLPQG